MRYVHMIGCLAGLVLICAWAGPAAAGNFSQCPGFAAYFAANPPADVAGPADRARYRNSWENGSGPAGFARAQAGVFHRNLGCLRRERKGCALE